ncbi:triose-phosphate isomerase [Alteribacillus sp. YIM 98480]|uniref:triose-phosphate isomerase n=1 Tax=Alteribacillus sp. YIM 98480 TaxID=2606599 RepID=UPI00131C49B5|nr:triose-phosphate isomerase [Alteribacillus sp. YIM 98480]
MNEKILIGTNWKMTKTLAEGRDYLRRLIEIKKSLSSKIELFVIPSFPHLYPLKELLQESDIKLGAQTMHWEERGAYTGEVSPLMLEEAGVDLIELGHSERRQYYNENDIDLNKKVKAALQKRITPLLCIGENSVDKARNTGNEKIRKQLKVSLYGLTKEEISNVQIAYEPVWAIGSKGVPASAEYVREQHSNIRHLLIELFDETGEDVPILYGGSVNEQNFESYLNCKNVNGLFIGRSAWDIQSFEKILLTIDKNY